MDVRSFTRHNALAVNTHTFYRTVGHHHFDFTYDDGNGGFAYPESSLMLVKCEDGRWFIQQEIGFEYSQFEGVVKHRTDLETMPTFYPNVEEAAKAAFRMIQQVYPTTPNGHLTDFLLDD